MRPAGPTVAAVAVAATVAALLERLWFSRAWGESLSLTSAFYYGDAPRFVEYAIAILHGRTFDNGIPFHPPGWPLLLVAYLKLLGFAPTLLADAPVQAVKLLVSTLSALSVGVAILAAYEIAGTGAMLGVALLAPFHFGHIVQGTVANSEALYSLCVAVFMWLSYRWLRTPPLRVGWGLAAGSCAGAATLVRPEFLACAAVVLAGGWPRTRRVESRAAASAPLAAFALTFAAILLPSTIWHWRTLSTFNATHVGRVAGPIPRFAPVTSYGPFNFAMANHEEADGGPNRDHPMLDRCNPENDLRLAAGQLDLACPAIYELYVDGYRIGATWLLDHPGDALALTGRKLAYSIGFLGQGYFIDDLGPGVDGTRRRVDLIDPSRSWLIPVHLCLLGAGIVLLRGRPDALLATLAPLVALVGAIVLFYGYVRLGIGYMPAVWTLQGTAIASGVSRLAGTRLSGAMAVRATVITLALLAGVEFLRVGTPRSVVLDGVRTERGALVQDETLDVRRAR